MLNKRQKKELKEFIKAMCWLLSGALQFAGLLNGTAIPDTILFICTILGWAVSSCFWLVNADNIDQRIIYCAIKTLYLYGVCAYIIFIK